MVCQSSHVSTPGDYDSQTSRKVFAWFPGACPSISVGKVYRDPFKDVILIVSQDPLGRSCIPNDLLLKAKNKKDGSLDLHTSNDSTPSPETPPHLTSI